MAKSTDTATTADKDSGFLSHFDGTSILTGVLGIVSMVYPPAAPIIGIIEKAAPYIIAAKPLISAAISEGGSAFEAATKAAPQLAQAIKDLASHAFAGGIKFGSTDMGSVENIARAVFGFRQMTPEEEKRWMDRMTPGNDPSQENSKYTIG